MHRLRDPRFFLIALFLGILAAVPLLQTIMEVRQESGIHALELFSETPTAENLRAFEKNLEKTSWAARISRPWLQFAQFAWFKDGGEKVVVGSSGWYFYKPGLLYMAARPETRAKENDTNDPVAAIIHFRDQLAAHGIRLLVMPIPNKDTIYPDRLTSRIKSPQIALAPRTGEILERLKAAKVQTIDLFQEFALARQQGSGSVQETPLYLAQDTHWSPAGVAVAAKAAARRLAELGWLNPGEVAYSERPAPVQRMGDLVRMLQSPVIERSLKPEQVNTAQVIRGADQLYKDEAEAEILVLGDSFMRIYQQDAPESAGFIAHLAKELRQPMLSIVNDGGGSTLVREELSSGPVFLKNKKVMIWGFVERDFGLGIKGWQHVKLPAPVALQQQ
ncbi:MAG TPA: hypothetical protein VF773_01405 [Verrucomicrobiae bacterium]